MTEGPDDASIIRRVAALPVARSSSTQSAPASQSVSATSTSRHAPPGDRQHGGGSTPGGSGSDGYKPYTAFDRHELSQILKVYGRMVAAGEWRDYAIDHLADRAVFSIFRRSSEVPLYRIEKNPRLARRQGAYAVITQTGMILKRGPDLSRVLRVIDKSLTLVEA